jgi:hypothetical protein
MDALIILWIIQVTFHLVLNHQKDKRSSKLNFHYYLLLQMVKLLKFIFSLVYYSLDLTEYHSCRFYYPFII